VAPKRQAGSRARGRSTGAQSGAWPGWFDVSPTR
jgi:hypothetical protein